ncbi:NAD-dependent epimerase/dehydratase family protein [Mycolicibacterium cosmeticum]|uniref:NAD-dependent epimerase/dehydratase family protein n=1 Tax=Mycolicibacterium cosmeticum TaxID=258533 RepID=UPI003D16120C
MNADARRVLVTGAGGRVAAIVVPLLADRHHLVLTDNDQHRLTPLAHYGEILPGDLLSTADANRLARAADVIVHLAGNGHQDATWQQLYDANVRATVNLLNAAAPQRCTTFIYVSSVQAVAGYPRSRAPLTAELPPLPSSVYGLTKAFGEMYLHATAHHFCSAAILRLGAFAGAPANEDISRVKANPDSLTRTLDAALGWTGPGVATFNVVSVAGRLVPVDAAGWRAQSSPNGHELQSPRARPHEV